MMRDAFKVDDPASSQGRMWAQNGEIKHFHSTMNIYIKSI